MITWTPCRWRVAGARDRLNEVFIESVANIEGPDRYAVRKDGCCLSKRGKWEYEPMPSSRTEAFFKRCRFATFEDAARAYERAVEKGTL